MLGMGVVGEEEGVLFTTVSWISLIRFVRPFPSCSCVQSVLQDDKFPNPKTPVQTANVVMDRSSRVVSVLCCCLISGQHLSWRMYFGQSTWGSLLKTNRNHPSFNRWHRGNCFNIERDKKRLNTHPGCVPMTFHSGGVDCRVGTRSSNRF